MATITTTEKGFQKVFGQYGNGNGAVYTVTVTPGTAVLSKYDVVRRPIRGGVGATVATGGVSGSVSYTELADFDFELEVWADIRTIGTVAVSVSASGGGSLINMATHTQDESSNVIGYAQNSGTPVTRLGSGLAVLLPSSGSVAANGALTLTTGIPLSGGYSWGCYMYFPAGAVYSGSAAGMYYVVMNSVSTGTIYNDIYSGGQPSIPATPTPIVAAGPGAYTQTTAQISLTWQTLGANSLGVSGRLMVQPCFVFPNNANNKVTSVYFGGSVVFAKTRTTSTQETPLVDIRSRGVATRQISAWATSSGPATSSTAGVVNTAIDTTADVIVSMRGQLAVATDYIILESYSLDLYSFT